MLMSASCSNCMQFVKCCTTFCARSCRSERTTGPANCETGPMAISAKLLGEDEYVVVSTRTHWKALIGPVFLLLVVAGLGGFLAAIVPAGSLQTPAPIAIPAGRGGGPPVFAPETVPGWVSPAEPHTQPA